MRKKIGSVTLGLFSMAAFGWGQNPSAPPAPPAASANSQINLTLLVEALKTASTFHDLVRNLNVEKNLNPEQSATPMDRTAAIMGAGAGAGAAIGELSHTQKGILIGVAAGAAGAFVIDQLLREREAKAAATSSAAPVPLATR